MAIARCVSTLPPTDSWRTVPAHTESRDELEGKRASHSFWGEAGLLAPKPAGAMRAWLLLLAALAPLCAGHDGATLSDREWDIVTSGAYRITGRLILASDADGDGHVTAAELTAALRGAGAQVDEASIATLLALADTDGDGSLDEAEVHAAIDSVIAWGKGRLSAWAAKQVMEGRTELTFPMFHYDASREDMRQFLNGGASAEVQAAILRLLFGVLDANGNGMVEVEETVQPVLQGLRYLQGRLGTGMLGVVLHGSGFDRDGSGTLSAAEFSAGAAEMGFEDGEVAGHYFDQVDVDKDGEVGAEELGSAVATVLDTAIEALEELRARLAGEEEDSGTVEGEVSPSGTLSFPGAVAADFPGASTASDFAQFGVLGDGEHEHEHGGSGYVCRHCGANVAAAAARLRIADLPEGVTGDGKVSEVSEPSGPGELYSVTNPHGFHHDLLLFASATV